jgi:hypothetical protein
VTDTGIELRERVRTSTPWWVKGGLKLALAKAPIGYRLLHGLKLARHGGMERPEFAYDAFRRHFDSADFHRKTGGFTSLELGPGDSLCMAVISRAHGGESSCHVDVGPFASTDVELYRRMVRHLTERGLAPPSLSSAGSFQEVQRICRARYETTGLAALRKLPSESFDFIYSNGVLQSIYLDEVEPTLRELRRLIHPQGVAVHSVDLRDTMGQSLNHLRFSRKVWESGWFHDAGFYTNRLRLSELNSLTRGAGFEPDVVELNRWPKPPLPRHKLAAPYRETSQEDYEAMTIRVVHRPVSVNAGGARA